MFSNIFTVYRRRKMMKKLPAALKPALEKVDAIPYINRGGCGVVALGVHRWCKRWNIKNEIVFVYSSLYNFRNNSQIIQAGQNTLVAPGHVLVFLPSQGVYIDSSGCSRIETWGEYHHNVTEADLLATLNAPNGRHDPFDSDGGWNNLFEREHVDEIGKILGVSLFDVKIR